MRKKYQTDEERKAARREYFKQYYQNNAEHFKQYYQDNAERIKEYSKKWNEQNAEHIKEYYKQYQKDNPIGRANSLIASYREKDKKYNRGECTLTAKWVVEKIFSNSCHYCGESNWKRLGCDRIDNTKPHTQDNVVPCCFSCNCKRGKKDYSSFVNEIKHKGYNQL